MAKKGLRDKKTGYGRNDLCPCGSGLKYKKCCKPMPRMKTDDERKADEERRKKSGGTTISEYIQFTQMLARMDMRRELSVDHGDLPDRVKADGR